MSGIICLNVKDPGVDFHLRCNAVGSNQTAAEGPTVQIEGMGGRYQIAALEPVSCVHFRFFRLTKSSG